MAEQNHFYIISYDLDNQSDPAKSKRLLDFLRKYHSVCLTKSTWLFCTPSDCYTVFSHISRIINPSDIGNPSFLGINLSPDQDRDRIFVAEITGKVFGDYLICDEPGSKLTLQRLIEVYGSNLIEYGFDSII